MIKILIAVFSITALFLNASQTNITPLENSANPLVEQREDLPLISSTEDLDHDNLPHLNDSTTSYESAFIKMIFVLIGILVCTCLGFYFFKKLSSSRIQQTNHFRNIKILEKRAISPKSMLYLIEVGGKKILLGESQLELRHISQLDWIEAEKKGL